MYTVDVVSQSQNQLDQSNILPNKAQRNQPSQSRFCVTGIRDQNENLPLNIKKNFKKYAPLIYSEFHQN